MSKRLEKSEVVRGQKIWIDINGNIESRYFVEFTDQGYRWAFDEELTSVMYDRAFIAFATEYDGVADKLESALRRMDYAKAEVDRWFRELMATKEQL